MRPDIALHCPRCAQPVAALIIANNRRIAVELDTHPCQLDMVQRLRLAAEALSARAASVEFWAAADGHPV